MAQEKAVRVTKKHLEQSRKSLRVDPRENEPRLVNPDSVVSSVSHMLAFYGLNFDNAARKKWVLSYVETHDKALAKDLNGVNKHYFTTVGSLVRMLENGVEIPGICLHDRIISMASSIRYKKSIQDTPEKAPDQAIEPSSEEVDTQGTPKKNNTQFLGEFEGFLDDVLGKKKNLGLGYWAKQEGLNMTQAEVLKNHVAKKVSEYQLVVDDKELLGCYGLTKRECQVILDSLVGAIADLDTTFQRKQRKKKPLTVEKMVSKIRYQEADTTLGIKSFNPTQIIGKSCMILYNTKTRKLQFYYSKGTGFTVDGMHIGNIDETKSMQKTLRNPSDQLINILQLSKKGAESSFKMIKAIEIPVDSKTTQYTILCKILS